MREDQIATGTETLFEKMATDTIEALQALLPTAPAWLTNGICDALSEELRQTDIDNIDGSYAFIAERLGEISGAINQNINDSTFASLCSVITKQGWGAITVEIKNGTPVMVREYRKDIKL